MKKFKYANNIEFLKAFGEKLAEVQKNESNTKLTIDQIFDVYLSVAECVHVVYSETYEETLLPDYDRQRYMSNHWFLYDELCLICREFRLGVRTPMSKAKQSCDSTSSCSCSFIFDYHKRREHL